MVQINRMILIALVLLTAQVRADGHTGITLTLDNFHRAAATADMDSYFATMSDDVVFLGTDGSERWQGQDFRVFVQSHFAAGRGWTYVPVQRNVMLAADGQTAWFDETLQNDGLGICRGSGVLVKSGGEWKIAQYNLSVPAASAMTVEAADVDESIPEQSTAGEPDPKVAPAGCKRKRFKTNRKAGC